MNLYDVDFWRTHFNWPLLTVSLLGVVAASVLRSLLNNPRKLPQVRAWLLTLWLPAVTGFGVSAAYGYVSRWFVYLYVLFVLGVCAAVLLRLRRYRPAATALWALLPLVVYDIINLVLRYRDLQFIQPYRGYYHVAGTGATLWLGGGLILAFTQKKNLRNEQVRLAEAEEARQQVAARNAELERLVAERTATLTTQADELQAALTELRQTQSQLIQSEKMASLGELTAGIAHEIQNPLNFVNNFADVSAELVQELEEEQSRPERDLALEDELLADLQHNLHKINLHGQRASSIVRGMLAHSRQHTGERQPTDLNALADEYLRLAYHGLRAKDKTFNATLDTDFAPDLPLVAVVPGDLGRVLLNLLTNAFYAVQKRQQAGSTPAYQPTVRVQTRREAGEVVITVRDNGTGIPEAVRQKIFQPFFTTKPTGEGTGLGLSLAHDIITKGHDGNLAVTSQEGEYTEFTVRLPLEPAAG